jgi:hypothetical protein
MKTSRKTIMGTTAGTTILVISGTVVMWPMSDLFFGPKLIQLGLFCHGSAQEKASEDDSFASITIVANRSGRDIRREAEKNNRPVVYISLREATSSHDLFMVMVSGLFSYEKLGIIGTLSQSMGIWWIVLFDVVMGTDPPHTRKVHFSVLLQHTKRALQMHTALYPHSRRCATRERKAPLPPLSFILYFFSLFLSFILCFSLSLSAIPCRASHQNVFARRPLIIIDHFDKALSYHVKDRPADNPQSPESQAVRAMLLKLGAWSASLCFDENLVDICVCAAAPSTLASFFLLWPHKNADVVYNASRSSSREFERGLGGLYHSLTS